MHQLDNMTAVLLLLLLLLYSPLQKVIIRSRRVDRYLVIQEDSQVVW